MTQSRDEGILRSRWVGGPMEALAFLHPRALGARTRQLPWTRALAAGLASFVTIFGLAQASNQLDQLLLIAPFGASCLLVFLLPYSPIAKPRNVIGGHVMAAAVGLLVLEAFGAGPLAYALGVSLAIALMALTGVVHPPAAGNPIIVIMTGAGWSFLLVPILSGAIVIVLAGMLFRRAGRETPAGV